MGDCFLWAVYAKITKFFNYIHTFRSFVLMLTKIWVGLYLGGFFINTFGHPDHNIDPWFQYFGEPISCDFKGLDVEMATHYCWIHGSSYIPPQYQGHMKCITDLDGVRSADEAPDTSYYQVAAG
jgi:hypothetical protein